MVWESAISQDLNSLQTIFSGSTAAILGYLTYRLSTLEGKLESIKEKLFEHIVSEKAKQ